MNPQTFQAKAHSYFAKELVFQSPNKHNFHKIPSVSKETKCLTVKRTGTDKKNVTAKTSK